MVYCAFGLVPSACRDRVLLPLLSLVCPLIYPIKTKYLYSNMLCMHFALMWLGSVT